MKRFLIIFGTFLLFLISMATMFKIMHWPGAGPLFVIGMTLFSIFFLPIFFIERMTQKKTALNIGVNILGLITTSSIFMGVLFKMMHWPGAGPMIVLGTTLFMFPTLGLFTIQQYNEYQRRFSEFWRTVVIGVLVSVFLLFWGMNVTRNVLFSFIIVEDATLETNKNLNEYNQFVLDEIKQRSLTEPLNPIKAQYIHEQTLEMLEYVETIKSEMIQIADPSQNASAIENHWNIMGKDNYDIPTHYIGSPGSKGEELYDRLNSYKTNLKVAMQTLPFINTETVESFGDFGIHTELNENITQDYDLKWNEGMFKNQTVSGALSILTSIQNELLNAEFKSLKLILMNTK